MRLPILAVMAALMACSAAAQTPPTAPMPPMPMPDSPSARPPIQPLPATLSDADAACQRGNQPACEQAGKIRAKILSGGALVPDPPPVEGGGRR